MNCDSALRRKMKNQKLGYQPFIPCIGNTPNGKQRATVFDLEIKRKSSVNRKSQSH